jgi:two-component system CheB/CheR fusion protein
MAKPGLAFELRSAIHKVSKTGERTKKTGLEIKDKDVTRHISIEVLPLKSEEGELLYMVVFEEVHTPMLGEIKPSLLKDKLVKQLQDELNAVKEDMRSIIEEQEASNEELQSANEEIVSSNEELQSINEELETSKEEVESTNEELITINSELQVRNEQLAEAYDYSEAVIATIREAVLVLDQNLRVKTANRSFYRTFQLKEEGTEGLLVYELGHKQWNIPQLRELLENIIPQKTQFNGFEIKHYFPGLGEKTMLLNARQLVQKIHGQQLILVAIEDITEHKEAEKVIAEREAWLRNMADNAPVMIWVADKDKSRTFSNKTWLAYTGRTPEQEEGSGWKDDIHPHDLEDYLKVFNKGFEEKKSYQSEYRLRRIDGEYRWILSIAKPTYSSEGTFTGFIGTCTEIHDKRLMNEELEKRVEQRTNDLQEMNKELERSNSELQQFAYVASHDLQEPLRKIITFSDSLDRYKDNLPEKGKAYVEKIATSAERMTRLIDDLLNFSRISRADEQFASTDLNDVLKSVLGDFDLIINQKKAIISKDKLPEIEAIPIQMKQLFHNLLSNALKFSKEGVAPLINITSRKLPKEEVEKLLVPNRSLDYIEIVFKDNGIGFNADFCEQIFNVFQRLNASKDYPGTGIGLALCRKIVNNHGGTIHAYSQENEGASFYVVLPVKRGGNQ